MTSLHLHSPFAFDRQCIYGREKIWPFLVFCVIMVVIAIVITSIAIAVVVIVVVIIIIIVVVVIVVVASDDLSQEGAVFKEARIIEFAAC